MRYGLVGCLALMVTLPACAESNVALVASLWGDDSTGLVVASGPALSRSTTDSGLVSYADGSEERACGSEVGRQDGVVLIGRSGSATPDYYATSEIEAAGRPVWISASNPNGSFQPYLIRIVGSAQPILDGTVILGQ